MKAAGGKLLAALLAGAILIAWAVIAHVTSQQTEAGHWAVLIAVAPLLFIAFGFLRGTGRGRLARLIAIGLAVGGLYLAWPILQQNVHSMYFVQHVGINSMLGLLFGRTLFGGREPLVTHFASLVHEHMSPELLRYSRQVTIVWTLYFTGMTCASVGLYFFAPLEAWSLLANVLTLPLVGLIFLIEALVRRHVLPPEDHLGIGDTIRAYRLAMARHTSGNAARRD